MRKLLHLFLLLLLVVSASAQTEGWITVEYAWDCNGRDYSIELEISEELYEYYQDEREHQAYHYKIENTETPVNFYTFILSEHDRYVIQGLATQFEELAISDLGRLNLALTFVQSLPYAYDIDTKGEDEYVRYPVETLVDGCGDCEDKVALLAAILHEMDIDFVLLSLPEHLAIGVNCAGVDARSYLLFQDRRYFYLETTLPGWKVGQVPEDYFGMEMEVVPCDAMPTLIVKGIRFDSKPTMVSEKADCELRVELHNLGPGKLQNPLLRMVIFHHERRKDRILTEQTFRLDDMEEGEKRLETIKLKSMIRENARLRLELSADDIPTQEFDLRLDYQRDVSFHNKSSFSR